MSNLRRHLLDVNVLIAILDSVHTHHRIAKEWFDSPGLQWVLCPFSEGGVLRYLTRPRAGTGAPLVNMEDATELLAKLADASGYHYQHITADWKTLTAPFAKQIFGHNQVTDAWLLGVALQEGLTLVTFDRAMLHMAGEHRGSVVVLEG